MFEYRLEQYFYISVDSFIKQNSNKIFTIEHFVLDGLHI
jgi:hypothetical protein